MSEENLEKRRALEAALGQIEKQFGKGSIMKELKVLSTSLKRIWIQ